MAHTGIAGSADSGFMMKRRWLITILLGLIAGSLIFTKLGEDWMEAYVENRVRVRLVDYEALRLFREESQDVYKRLQLALNNSWKQKPYKDDRELLSKRLNVLSMELNQLLCDLQDDITVTGGWCGKNFKEGHMTDEGLAVKLSQMLKGQTVGSFGDGPGHYKKLLTKSGLVKLYDAYDGSPYIENATNSNVRYLELSIPQYGLPIYDWVISLEVAEHIPREYEDIFLSNIIRHAKKGIILSWAVQDVGLGHVNTRSGEYVERKMRKLCFDKNARRSNELRNVSKLWWLKMNLNVFIRRRNCTIVALDA